MQDLWNSILALISRVVTPDWGALISLIPLALLGVVLLFFLWTVRQFATVGPTRRAPARITPIAPPELHMPGPSYAPIFAAFGVAASLWGLVVGGSATYVGALVLLGTLLYWGREAIRDFDRDTHVEMLPAVIHAGPPPGVHMPGPSFRPLLGALGTAALMAGLVAGGWLLGAGVIILVMTLTGWLVDARAEYTKTVEADRTGHLENIPAPRWPRRALQVGVFIFTFALLAEAGIFPPRTSDTATGPGGSRAPSAAGSVPATAFTIVAKGIAFNMTVITVPANAAFTIAFDNQDPPGVTHDIDIRAADKTTVVQNQEVTNGGSRATYAYTGLAPGTYVFICSIHPSVMSGTLTVK